MIASGFHCPGRHFPKIFVPSGTRASFTGGGISVIGVFDETAGDEGFRLAVNFAWSARVLTASCYMENGGASSFDEDGTVTDEREPARKIETSSYTQDFAPGVAYAALDHCPVFENIVYVTDLNRYALTVSNFISVASSYTPSESEFSYPITMPAGMTTDRKMLHNRELVYDEELEEFVYLPGEGELVLSFEYWTYS